MEKDKRMAVSTPWGPAQTAIEFAPGIISYTTAGHGGIWLSPERQKALAWPDNFLRDPAWWEEDCDWAIPYYFFRKDIEAAGTAGNFGSNLVAAIQTINGWHPEFAKREGLGKLVKIDHATGYAAAGGDL